MKDFDAIKAATPNTLAIGQTQDVVALLKVPDKASTAVVNTVAEKTQLLTSIHPSIPASISATPEETMSSAGSPARLENSSGLPRQMRHRSDWSERKVIASGPHPPGLPGKKTNNEPLHRASKTASL